ncbi:MULTISPECIES: tail fiber domain-containing protein [unclassified Enterobacter]|uniref:tail fiber domain-containing protein n=1 Tax=unclassified Enterobacter TaxID=2608935 RepID=UPI00292A7361|nr:tail fiber domain-containing protein [Enterobacter sp. 23-M-SZ-13]MDV0596263.1 tail fiber domain-containing protein [Enterobacter sp. 23-M-SZ-13]
MLYNTGTIAISGNTLTGTGTNFTAAGSLIRNGCTVIALTSPAQVFQITAIGGATSLTVTPAASPAIPAGTKYSILLSDSLSVDGLAQDIAETFTMYQRYMSGFADVMNGTTDVTITINGVAVTVPGQKSLAKKGANSDITSLSGLTTALSVGQGGTGAKTASDARTNIGLGSSSDVGFAKVVSTVVDGRGLSHVGARPNVNDIYTFQPADTSTVGAYPNEIRGQWFSDLWRIGGIRGGGQELESFSIRITGATTQYWTFNRSNSAVTTAAGTITPVASDERVKNIIREISEEEAVQFIQGLRPIRYAFKWSPDQVRVGYSAQNVEALDAELIATSSLTVNDEEGETTTYEDGKIVDPGEIGAAYLVPVVQQLLRRVSELETRLTQMVS